MTCDRRLTEHAIIETYFAPLAAQYPGALSLDDDGAIIACPVGEELVATTDPLIEGVHFFPGEDPAVLGWKALAVNVSDLIAMGARPAAYLLAVALPGTPDRAWLAKFTGGLRDAQTAFACHLAGGDTDRTTGPLSITITALGTVACGKAVRRCAAKLGDAIFVSGTIGDATLGLRIARDPGWAQTAGLDGAMSQYLLERWRRPRPSAALAPLLVKERAAATDVSDGLMRDLKHIADSSGLGARIEAHSVPLSQAAQAAVASGAVSIADLMCGGEDYEIVAAVAPDRAAAFQSAAAAAGIVVTRIGEMTTPGTPVAAVDETGRPIDVGRMGFDHFAQE